MFLKSNLQLRRKMISVSLHRLTVHLLKSLPFRKQKINHRYLITHQSSNKSLKRQRKKENLDRKNLKKESQKKLRIESYCINRLNLTNQDNLITEMQMESCSSVRRLVMKKFNKRQIVRRVVFDSQCQQLTRSSG